MVEDCTESQLNDEEFRFQKGRGYVYQIFALESVPENYLNKEKASIAFMDLKKEYDRVD